MNAIKVTLDASKLPDFETIFGRFVFTAGQRIRARMREKLHEEKHGRLYAKRRGVGFTRAHRASAPGEAPASDSGDFERSLNVVRRSSLEVDVETALDYPGMLETGTSAPSTRGGKMGPHRGGIAPRPLWQVTVDEMIPVLENDLYQMMA